MTLARTTPLRTRQRIRPVSAKRQKHRASAEGKAGLAHMARVRSLPCIICAEWGFTQTSPTEAHHCIHGRFSARKVSDLLTISLCAEHHRESADPQKIAVHQNPAKWKHHYGNDFDWLSWVEVQLGDDR